MAELVEDYGPCVLRGASVVEDEGDLEDHLVGGDLPVDDLDGLVLDPRARDVAQGLGGALDAQPDGVVEARRGASGDRRDACDRSHGGPPVPIPVLPGSALSRLTPSTLPPGRASRKQRPRSWDHRG